MRFRIKHGFDIPLAGKPDAGLATLEEFPRRVGLVGQDYGDLRPAMMVKKGDRVRAGETLFNDRRFPEIRVAAPGSGEISDIRWGPRRRLEAIVIELNDDPPIEFEQFDATALAELPADAVRERLLESGQWVAFRARPFENIPPPDMEPRAIFISAIDTNPLAPDPFETISDCASDFYNGVAVVSRLTSKSVYVCTAGGQHLSLPDLANVSQVEFLGPHPAGLPGTHIHALEQVGDVPDLWHIGYQDVIAIGQLFTSGALSPHRVVSVGGPAARSPRLIRVRIGMELAGLLQQETSSECLVISGSILSGRQVPGYLGRYHNQVTLLPHAQEPPSRIGKIARMIWRGNTGLDRATSSALHGLPGGMLPLEDFDRVWPYRTPPAALLRALLVGDTDSAVEMGCRGLGEDDLALCTYVCAGKHDYGSALRSALSDIQRIG